MRKKIRCKTSCPAASPTLNPIYPWYKLAYQYAQGCSRNGVTTGLYVLLPCSDWVFCSLVVGPYSKQVYFVIFSLRRTFLDVPEQPIEPFRAQRLAGTSTKQASGEGSHRVGVPGRGVGRRRPKPKISSPSVPQALPIRDKTPLRFVLENHNFIRARQRKFACERVGLTTAVYSYY